MDVKLRAYHIALYDTYGSLLTDKQKTYFTAYYFDDLSLAEIAENYQVSRNAVHDQINKTILSLEHYEENLRLIQKENRLKEFADKIRNVDSKLYEEFISIVEEE